MKHNKLILATAALAFTYASCSKLGNKHQPLPLITVEKTIEVKIGEKVIVDLPNENTDDAYRVSTESTVAQTSTINTWQYEYTAPAAMPAGIATDEVVLTNTDENGGNSITVGGCNGNGSGNNHEGKGRADQHYTVNVHVKLIAAK